MSFLDGSSLEASHLSNLMPCGLSLIKISNYVIPAEVLPKISRITPGMDKHSTDLIDRRGQSHLW